MISILGSVLIFPQGHAKIDLAIRIREAREATMLTNMPRALQDKKIILLYFSLGTLLTIEIFSIQEYVLNTFNLMSGSRLFQYAGTRLMLDTFFCFSIISLLSRRYLYGIYVLQILLYLALIAYSNYFSKPPHLTTALYQAGEGVSVIGFGFELVANASMIVLLITLLTKLVITARCSLLKNFAIRHSALFYTPAVLYVGVLLMLGVYIKPLNATAANWSIDELMHGYGFAVPWISEAVYVNQNALLEAALDQASIVDNRLVGDSGLLTLPKKIFVLQIESLDFDILQRSINGKEITPNINSILSFSRTYRVRAHHFSGSSDADFVMLTGKRPNQIIAPFKVYGFPYRDTLIDAAKSVGYKTKSYHGNSGFFFERRNAFVTMGIDEILFREELVDKGLKPYGEWILDADMMRQIGFDANENDDKEFYFVITVTSHGPFSFLPDKEKYNFFKNAPSLREKYLNSIHYVDRVMGDFFSAIPDDSLVVIYGDHESGTGEKKLGLDGRRLEYIPAILYYKTESSSSQILRSYLEAKSDENLYLADFSNLLISALSRSHDNDMVE